MTPVPRDTCKLGAPCHKCTGDRGYYFVFKMKHVGGWHRVRCCGAPVTPADQSADLEDLAGRLLAGEDRLSEPGRYLVKGLLDEIVELRALVSRLSTDDGRPPG